jgi:hypothetical protein
VGSVGIDEVVKCFDGGDIESHWWFGECLCVLAVHATSCGCWSIGFTDYYGPVLFNYQGNSDAKLRVSGEWERSVRSDGTFLVKVVRLWPKEASDWAKLSVLRQQHHVMTVDVMTSSSLEDNSIPCIAAVFQEGGSMQLQAGGRVY